MTIVLVLGIDPGLKGALAFLEVDSRRLTTHAMPIETRKNGKTYLNAGEIATIVRTEAPDEAWIEDVYSSPQMGVVSAFTFGEGKGVLTGVLAALGVPVRRVAPAVWKGQLGLTADKADTKAFARALFPNVKISTEGKCEAALIALYGSLVQGLASKP